ncbi:hypothetical protein GGX14DRAFT_395612 [Mycena pura]|uniref:Uncharacterized protein n=1 Tax=Mycena pura TaxID=153505 RepID=A0AAD6YEJ2_9AGAR|nr:hypothetical protein GGX14DRAFT_395612 [Mycena pura]
MAESHSPGYADLSAQAEDHQTGKPESHSTALSPTGILQSGKMGLGHQKWDSAIKSGTGRVPVPSFSLLLTKSLDCHEDCRIEYLRVGGDVWQALIHVAPSFRWISYSSDQLISAIAENPPRRPSRPSFDGSQRTGAEALLQRGSTGERYYTRRALTQIKFPLEGTVSKNNVDNLEGRYDSFPFGTFSSDAHNLTRSCLLGERPRIRSFREVALPTCTNIG